MGVTIDNLQIEIQSSSTNAAKGITDLAGALERLKKNGSFKTVATNLNNLSNSLNNLQNVHRASNSLRTLANSIEKLQAIGSVSKIANSLKKLPEAFRSIEKIKIDSLAPQVERIATAVAPLSAVKAGGFGSMVNAMKNLGKVTESLDDTTIKAFADKIKTLNEELGPFASKMATVKSAFGSINSQARSAATSVNDFDHGIDTSTLNMSSFIDIVRTAAETVQRLVQEFSNFIAEAIEWDGIAARFGRGFGSQAAENYEWIKRLNEELGINIQEFMKYSSVYSTMLSGFGVDSKDAGKMALGYMELTYDIWAGYNDVYGSLEEAAEAVKSAIAGEVEPVRRAGFTIVEATLEQTAANHGLEISLANATEAQKSYLRYLTLIDQAHAQNLVGTYAKELNTAEGLMRTFAQQLKSLTQAFGSLFLPVLVRVMPWLQAFVELLTEAVYWAAGLFGIDIQPVDWGDYNAGVSDAIENTEGVTGALDDATAAAKELKNATLGIDELNVISPQSASSGSGSGGTGGGSGGGFDGLDVDSLWDESIFDSVQSKVDEIKNKLKGMFDDWLPTLQTIGAAIGAWTIASLLGQLGNAIGLGESFLGVVNTIKKLAATAIIIAVQFKLMKDAFGDFMGEDGTIFDYIEGVIIGAGATYLLYKMWGVGGLSIGLGVTAVASLSAVIEEGGVTDVESAVVALTGLAAALGAVATGVSALSGAWATVKTSGFVVGIIEFFKAAKFHAADVGWLAALFPKLSTAIAGIPGAFSSALPVLASAAPYVAIAAAVVGGITLAFVDYDFSEIGRTIGKAIGTALRKAGEWIGDVGSAIWDGLKAAFEWLKTSLDIEDFWDVLKILFVPGELMRRIGPDLEELFEKVSKAINDKIENLKGNINEFFSGFFDGLFEGLGLDVAWAEKFGEFFDIEYLDIVNLVMNPTSIGKYIMTGIGNGLDANPKTSALKDKLVSMWEGAKTWWDKKGSLSTYTPTIGNISTKLSSAWESAKTWWKDKRSSLSYTPSIGKIWEKLKTAWTSAKDWWNKSRSNLSYTPSIGSISSKLSSAWTSAKNWWSKNRSSLSYTPSIGSITDKLKSAWNSAKSWWNKNVSLSTKLNVSVPTIKVKWETASAFGKEFRYPTGFSLKFAANGGIFDQGSLIWAGERGPEVMATAAGGKTGVMNVQQMQDAVYEGVYAAVSAAMRGNGSNGTQTVKVYLDGKEITSTVEQHQHERGASIMGNGVYAY